MPEDVQRGLAELLPRLLAELPGDQDRVDDFEELFFEQGGTPGRTDRVASQHNWPRGRPSPPGRPTIDDSGDGMHHLIPASMIASADTSVRLSKPSDEVKSTLPPLARASRCFLAPARGHAGASGGVKVVRAAGSISRSSEGERARLDHLPGGDDEAVIGPSRRSGGPPAPVRSSYDSRFGSSDGPGSFRVILT
ncbi:DUF2171 domain-containing protein [Tundrisphaera lichenicola]|uniref:DUF2171 domain-containing protein n=1 Tax=Tundrisphaera lichenicola TaxID=2029860 RepID=UPI003EBC05C6